MSKESVSITKKHLSKVARNFITATAAATAFAGSGASASANTGERAQVIPSPVLNGGTLAPSPSSVSATNPNQRMTLTKAEKKLSEKARRDVAVLVKRIVNDNISNGWQEDVKFVLSANRKAIISAKIPVNVAGSSEVQDQFTIATKVSPSGKILFTPKAIDEFVVVQGGTDNLGNNLIPSSSIGFQFDNNGAVVIGTTKTSSTGTKGNVYTTYPVSPGEHPLTEKQLSVNLQQVSNIVSDAESQNS